MELDKKEHKLIENSVYWAVMIGSTFCISLFIYRLIFNNGENLNYILLIIGLYNLYSIYTKKEDDPKENDYDYND